MTQTPEQLRREYICALSLLDLAELSRLFAACLEPPAPAGAEDEKADWLPFDRNTRRKIQEARHSQLASSAAWLAAVDRLPHRLKLPPAMDAARLDRLRLIWDSQVAGLEEVYETLLIQAVNYGRTRRARPLLLVGPPGCGKSTVSQVYARMLGLPFYRISCPHLGNGGGLAGDRAVYTGSGMGALMEGVCSCGCGNPLFILDEIDKVSAESNSQNPSFSSVLLNLLDGFGHQFRDSFLGFEADLSHAVFCLVANDLEGLPPALVDRCLGIRFPAPSREQLTRILDRFTLPEACQNRPEVAFCPDAARLMVEQGWPAGLQSPRQYEALASQLCGAAELAALRQGHRVEIGPAQILGALRARRDLQPRALGFADRAG